MKINEILKNKYVFFFIGSLITFSITSGIFDSDDQDIYKITLILIGSIFMIVIYLQSGGNKKDESEEPADRYFLSGKLQAETIKKNINELNNKVNEIKSGINISNEEREKVIDELSKGINDEVISLAFKKEAAKLAESISDELKVAEISKDSLRISDRLSREIQDLRLRSSLNLALGMTITITGLVFLWRNSVLIETSDLFHPIVNSSAALAEHDKAIFIIATRLSIVLLIEVFAYFFLRLYKQAINEIKYMQNELTNIESKLAAVKFALLSGSKESIKASIIELSKTERNFILKKSQTSVELEKAKSENKLSEKLIKVIPSLISKTKD